MLQSGFGLVLEEFDGELNLLSFRDMPSHGHVIGVLPVAPKSRMHSLGNNTWLIQRVVGGVCPREVKEEVMNEVRDVDCRDSSTFLLHVDGNVEKLFLVRQHGIADMNNAHTKHADVPDQTSVPRKNICTGRSGRTRTVVINLCPDGLRQ